MCEHHWVLDGIENADGSTGRTVRMHCDKCGDLRSLVTQASDADIAEQFANQ